MLKIVNGVAVEMTAQEIAAFEASRAGGRRLIPKSTVTARLRTIDKFGTAWAALLADGDLFDKWFTPDWPEVFADDAGLLASLEAFGCTAEEIAFVVAP